MKLLRSVKSLSGLVLLVMAVTILAQPSQAAATDCYDTPAQLTGYYTPIPGQQRYALGSFAADVRMNGNWHTADGTQVGPGVIAAPRSYPFGTQITIPPIGGGLGGYTGVVHDRGGAIRVYGGVPRFDLWMGVGDEGLLRALQLGKRTVTVTVCGAGTANVAVTAAEQPEVASFGGLLAVNSPEIIQTTVKLNNIRRKSSPQVQKLQRFLADMGVYHGSVSGQAGKITENALETLRKDQGKVEDQVYAGPAQNTSDKMPEFTAVIPARRDRLTDEIPLRQFGRGAFGDDVAKLQEALLNLGYTVQITGVYDKQTKAAVEAFQKKEGLNNQIKSELGYYDTLTQTTLLQLMADFDSLAILEVRSRYGVDAEEPENDWSATLIDAAKRNLALVRIVNVFKLDQQMG